MEVKVMLEWGVEGRVGTRGWDMGAVFEVEVAEVVVWLEVPEGAWDVGAVVALDAEAVVWLEVVDDNDVLLFP